VLVAHPEVEEGRRTAEALSSWGLETMVVADGVEAILAIQRELPRLVVLDAALPKMFGFQVCEIVKRNESLRAIQVVLVGAIHHQDRYRRPPGELYGADAYVERHHLPEALAPLFEEFGLPVQVPKEELARSRESRATPAAASEPRLQTPEPRLEAPEPLARPTPPEPAPVREPEPRVEPVPEAPTQPPREPAPRDPALAAEFEQAERLARIIVSDVVLYNPEKFEAGVRDGTVLQALESELAEGRSLFAQRVDPRVGDPGEFLERELVRVARSRGMT
jgi:CheY-like chemotaxis protein